MRRSYRRKGIEHFTPVQRALLRRAAECEPKALMLEDPALCREAEELVLDRVLGKVEIRGAQAYRLTEFGRAALVMERVLHRAADAA
jgi:hypothetical protein